MIDEVDVFYAEHIARALISDKYSFPKNDSARDGKHSVKVEMKVPWHKKTYGSSASAAFTSADNIIKHSNCFGSARVVPRFLYSPKSTLFFEFSFPEPVREAQYFVKQDRRRFLADYATYLLAQAVSHALAGYHPELQEQLKKEFPNPRHPRDLNKEQVAEKVRLKRGQIKSALSNFGQRVMTVAAWPKRRQQTRYLPPKSSR